MTDGDSLAKCCADLWSGCYSATYGPAPASGQACKPIRQSASPCRIPG